MKLERIIPKTKVRSGVEGFSITPKGDFSFTKKTTEDLIKENRGVNFYKDEENNWYLEFVEVGDIDLRINKGKPARFKNINLFNKIAHTTDNSLVQNIKALLGKPTTENNRTVYPILIKRGTFQYR